MLCKENGIAKNHRAVPDDMKAERVVKEKAAAKGKKGGQMTLDRIAKKVETPTNFSQEAIIQAVTEHVVCGDQVTSIHYIIYFPRDLRYCAGFGDRG